MKKFYSGFKILLIAGMSFGIVLPTKAQITHKSIPLDCGGWFSGFATHSSGRIYGYGDVFGAWRSDDSGRTWSYLNRDITSDENFVSGIAVDSADANRVAFRSDGKLMRSNDGGATWAASLTGLTDPTSTGLIRGALPVMFHPSYSNDLWVAATRTNITGGLWRSTGGGTWTKVGGTTFDTVKIITIYADASRPNQIWAGTVGGLFVSVNGGTDWTQVWGQGISVSTAYDAPRGGMAPTVKGIYRRSDGVALFISDAGGYRVTASDWNNPATFVFEKKISDYGGYGPDAAGLVLNANGVESFFNSRQTTRQISNDGGVTWVTKPMTMSTPPTPIWESPNLTSAPPSQTDQIVQDPTNLSRWFMTNGSSPLVSNDAGTNWTYVPNNSGIAGVMTYKVNFVRNNPNMALIPGADQGVIIVTDGGSSGTASAASNPSINKLMNVHEVMSSNDGTILVAAGVDQSANESMIVRSNNSGATWTALDLTNSGLPYSREGIQRSVMTPGNPNDFLVMMGDGANSTAPLVWRTQNGGASFSAVNGLPNAMDTGARYWWANSYLDYDGVNTSTRYLVARPNLFFRSTDNGANWTQLISPWGSNAWVWSFAVDRSTTGKLWAAGDWAGLKTSNDGGNTWTTVGSFNARVVDAANGRVAVWGKRSGDTWNKIYYSPDNGVTWTEATGPGNRYAHLKELAVDPWVAGKVWASGVSVNVITGLPDSTPTPTPIPVTVPSAPSNLSASAASRTQINLKWTDTSSNESGFAVERSPDNANWSQIATVATNATSYVSTGLTRNRLYYYRARAFNSGGNSGYSNTASARTLK